MAKCKEKDNTAYAFDSKMICKAKLCPVRYCPAGHKFIDFCPEIMSTSLWKNIHVKICDGQYFIDCSMIKCLHEREINLIYFLPGQLCPFYKGDQNDCF